jgi:hypothetical protein
MRLRGGGCGPSKAQETPFADVVLSEAPAAYYKMRKEADTWLVDEEVPLTEAQRQALHVATSKAVGRLGDKRCEEVDRYNPNQWKHNGGAAIDTLLSHTPLVCARFLLDLAEAGGILPRCQDMPPAAMITLENAWRIRYSTPGGAVLVLSYPCTTSDPNRPSPPPSPSTSQPQSSPSPSLGLSPHASRWGDRFHPDREGALLRQLIPLLRQELAPQRTFDRLTFDLFNENGDSRPKTGSIGVMIDYCCLPQHPRVGSETEQFQVCPRVCPF